MWFKNSSPQAVVYNLLSTGNDDVFIIQLQNELGSSTSINENTWNNMFNPCPNPITSLLTIESKKNICNAINTARNSIEQEMFKKIYSSTNAIALTLDVAPDLYFIEIIDEGKVSALKVIKE